MSVFTPLSAEQLRAFLARWELELADYRGAAEGIENSNFLVDAVDGGGHPRPLVLTLFEQTPPEELPPVIRLLERLDDAGLPVPVPLPDRDGHTLHELAGKPALLVPRLPGKHPQQPDAELCRALGAVLARLHGAGAEVTLTTDAEGLDRLAGWIEPGEEEAERIRAAWRTARAELPRGTLHGDLFRDNVMVVDNRISGLLDFYAAGHGTLLYDLAVCVNDWCGKADGTLDEPRRNALLAGYESERPLTPGERKYLPLALAVAALRFWLSRREARARERASAAGAGEKDPEEFARIFRARYRALP